ncbi:CHAPERONE DNAJ-DOMAIN SUPERFAMILY PROTEIN [Salix koriyanagi]|uniref:CHAPERONE DNAJ-DOMAIN SUPERFAMILY PROTEIN n=1 Tax=Salix koriyanagi TaxID=2511006 RepID=A0A9Q0YSQ3_9ROSI|nr:CHAPERONE DNAJ-DOMAIN SUPERFAMILY PROTEIN [Salix koriyanagi]
MGGEEINRSKDNPWPSPNRPPPYHEKSEDMSLWGVVLFGLIGATATTYALTRSQSTWKGATGSARSFRTYFQEEAWKNYNRRMQEAYEEETERVERIRRMQSVFNRERNKCKRDYERWRESGPENRELTSGEIQETVEAIHYHIITQFWDLTGPEQYHILKLRLRRHSGPRQRSFTQIRTKIIKRLPRQSSKR